MPGLETIHHLRHYCLHFCAESASGCLLLFPGLPPHHVAEPTVPSRKLNVEPTLIRYFLPNLFLWGLGRGSISHGLPDYRDPVPTQIWLSLSGETPFQNFLSEMHSHPTFSICHRNRSRKSGQVLPTLPINTETQTSLSSNQNHKL